MKKIFKSLSFLVILGLVACNVAKSISRAEAVEILAAIQEKQESNELKPYKALRFEMNQVEETKVADQTQKDKIEIVVAVDFNTKQAYYKSYQSWYGQSEDMENWLYFEDDKVFMLSDNKGEKLYRVYDVGENPDDQFANYASSVEQIATKNLKTYGPEILLSLFENLEKEEAPANLVSESYKTKGDGHLAIDLTIAAIPDSEVLEAKAEMHFVFDEYRLTSSDLKNSSNLPLSGLITSEMTLKANYKNAGISLPKLADFTLDSY